MPGHEVSHYTVSSALCVVTPSSVHACQNYSSQNEYQCPIAATPSFCVCVRYIEAIRRLKAAGKMFPRTIHMMFVPGKVDFLNGQEL